MNLNPDCQRQVSSMQNDEVSKNGLRRKQRMVNRKKIFFNTYCIALLLKKKGPKSHNKRGVSKGTAYTTSKSIP